MIVKEVITNHKNALLDGSHTIKKYRLVVYYLIWNIAFDDKDKQLLRLYHM